jgi:hypothetical protein
MYADKASQKQRFDRQHHHSKPNLSHRTPAPHRRSLNSKASTYNRPHQTPDTLSPRPTSTPALPELPKFLGHIGTRLCKTELWSRYATTIRPPPVAFLLGEGSRVLTISKPMKRWSIKYYNDTANQAKQATMDRQAAGGGLGEYYSEGETRAPAWLVVGNVDAVGEAVGLDGAALHGGFADTETPAIPSPWPPMRLPPITETARKKRTRC